MCQQDPDKATAMNVPKVFLDELCAQKCRIIALSTDQVYGGDQSALYLESSDDTQPVILRIRVSIMCTAKCAHASFNGTDSKPCLIEWNVLPNGLTNILL